MSMLTTLRGTNWTTRPLVSFQHIDLLVQVQPYTINESILSKTIYLEPHKPGNRYMSLDQDSTLVLSC